MQFIKEIPLGEDLFEGKSQDRIATSLIEQLQSDESNIIGIEGEWGSGKSNVVKIAENKLNIDIDEGDEEDKIEIPFFTYDVWGHQEDLQRRTILEELFSFLKKKNIFKDKKKEDEWEKEVKILTGKTVITEIKTMPSVSVGILVGYFILILTPVFPTFIELLKKENSWIKNIFMTNSWIEIILSFLPIFCLLLWFIFRLFCLLIKRKIRKEKDIWKESFKQMGNEIITIYKDKKIDNTTTEFTHESNPSIENFSDFLNRLLKDIKSERLVLVFDNMDRLPSEKIKEIWASIHILFAERSKITSKKIHVIIPFDRKHIQEAFQTTGDCAKGDCGDAYINKTFDIVYRVAPPILSDWKIFFKRKWGEAYGEVAEATKEEYDKVVQIFDLAHKNLTPRYIITFINESVSIKKVASKFMLDRYIALFILKRDEILEDPFKCIVEKSFLGNLDFLYREDENLQKSIASLVYQIDPEKALEVVYSHELKSAFENGDKEAAKDISTLPQFIDIFDSVFSEIINLEKTIEALISIPDENLKTKKPQVWEDVYARAKANETMLSKATETLHPYQEILLKNINKKEEYAAKIISDTRQNKDVKEIAYYNILKKISNYIEIANLAKEKRVIPESFLVLLKHAKNDYTITKMICDTTELDNLLAKQPIETLQDITQIRYATWEIKKNLKTFVTQLLGFTTTHAGNITYISIVIGIMENISQTPISHNLPDANIVNLFASSKGTPLYNSLLAMRITKAGNFTPNCIPHFDSVLNLDDHNLAKELQIVLPKYVTWGQMFLNLETMGKYLLYKKIVQIAVENTELRSSNNVLALLEKFDIIIKEGTIDANKLFGILNKWEWKSEWNNLTNDNIEKICNLSSLRYAINSETELAKNCRIEVKEYLKNLSAEEWTTRFADFKSCYGALEGQIVDFDWTTSSIEGVKNVLLKISHGELVASEKEKWNTIIKHINKKQNRLVGTFKDIRDFFINGNAITPDKFIFWGDWLFEYAELKERNDSLRTILPVTILKDESCLKIILKYKDNLPAIVKKAGDEAIDLKEYIIEEVKKAENSKMKEIFDILKLEIPPSDENLLEENKEQ